MTDVLLVLDRALTFYIYIMIARILLSWFPNINWYNQPFRFLRDVTDPVMEPFRQLVPPIGMIDISPIVLFLLLNLLQGLIRSACGPACY